MNVHDLADYIIVYTAAVLVIAHLTRFAADIAVSVGNARRRRTRRKTHARWVAARVAARETCEERMRREGYWNNPEITRAMDIAGSKAAPGYRPW